MNLADAAIELSKSPNHATDGTWMVYVDDELAGSVRPCWPGVYSARPHWQGWVNSIRVGRPCRTRKDAAVHVLDTYQRRHGN